ncbi:MAG: phage holin family protein [Nigerium sp.]|nr:phage holin family protein [Nigerium sp.]
MLRFFIQTTINLITAALGLLITAAMLPDFTVQPLGFVAAVVVVVIAQAILSPFVFSMSRKYAPALLGGIGIISTLLALIIASFMPGGITITGLTTWIAASLILWLCTSLGGWLLLWLAVKYRIGGFEG